MSAVVHSVGHAVGHAVGHDVVPEVAPKEMTEAAIWAALDTIHDPCSVRTGKPLGLVAMGLIESVEIDAASVRIRMVVTGPGCFFYFQFAESIERALDGIAGGREIDVAIDDAILWTRDRMRDPIRTIAIHPVGA
jgi:metal-sulfur cluster biosynthetic enzyme